MIRFVAVINVNYMLLTGYSGLLLLRLVSAFLIIYLFHSYVSGGCWSLVVVVFFVCASCCGDEDSSTAKD